MFSCPRTFSKEIKFYNLRSKHGSLKSGSHGDCKNNGLKYIIKEKLVIKAIWKVTFALTCPILTVQTINEIK